jgi:hypothetical protein
MGLEPIGVELTDFNKLELLRDEEERLSEELAGLEKSIRAAQTAVAEREYLASLSPYYSQASAEEAAAPRLPEMNSQRELVAGALEAGSKSSNFESFEQFRQSRG